VIVLVIHDFDIGARKPEGNAPIPAHPDRPETLSGAFERMESKPGQIHVPWRRGRIQSAKDQAKPIGMLSLDSGLRTRFEVSRQAFVPEASNHAIL
jgi:hypothetical protein